MMGLYSDVIFPWACDKFMSRPKFTDVRRETLAEVSGNVLEVGFGTGLNILHYPDTVDKITVVEPNAGMNRRAERRIRRAHIQVESHALGGETLPMGSETFDSVVSTWTLCSIDDVAKALREIHRVLRPEGRLFFLEHGLSDDAGVRRWQNILNPVQRVLGCGCNLNRNMKTLIEDAGFDVVRLKNFYMRNDLKTHSYMYQGVATKGRGI
jgi:ubiquinone/menaquinone biosynthesis C-methylase UbiE